MSHHDVSESPEIDQQEMDANSRADALALLALVAIIVVMAVFYASR